MKRLLFCIGTRPEAIKLAPLILAAERAGADVCVVTTGQHREMLDPFIELFQLKVKYPLQVLKSEQSLSELTAAIVTQVQPIFENEKPDVVVVQGDTTTAFACALAAFYEKIPVAHVEAGLRTHERYSPFPEEMNRKMIGAIATYHFAPTAASKGNLLSERITENVFVTGNTGVDALRITLEKLPKPSEISEKLILMTCHRRENHGEPLLEICAAALEIIEKHPDTRLVFPVHLNPQVRTIVKEKLGDHPRILLCNPLSYEEFAALMQKSYLLLTDSGGIQEEAPYLKLPIFVLRESTERPEGVKAGVSMLVGSDRATIVKQVSRALTDSKFYQQFQKSVNPYGDGFASEKILDTLLS